MNFHLLFLACSSVIDRGEPKWFSVDPHVHSSVGSNDTDGLGTPLVLSHYMNERGLDAVWITDHSNSLGSMDCSNVEDCPNQGPDFPAANWPENAWLGVEISPRSTEDELLTPTGHIGCIPIDISFENTTFTDRPFGEISGENALGQCHQAGGWSILNHPFGPATWVAYDWSSFNFDAMEVYNGSAGFDQSDWDAVEMWETLLIDGHSIVPIGASDSHRWDTPPPGTVLDSALGWPRTEIGTWSTDISTTDLMNGMVFLGDPSNHLRYSVSTNKGTYWPGEITDGKEAVLQITFASTEDSTILEVRHLSSNGAQTVLQANPSTDTQQLELPITKNGQYYVRILPSDIELGSRGFSMGNVIFVKYN